MNPNAPAGPARAQFHSLPLVEKTAAQVSILRSIVDAASGVLSPPRHQFDGTPSEEFDAESKAAAKKTLVLAFHQLDNVIDDQSRWGSAPAALEAEAMGLLKAEREKVAADAHFRQTLAQPFFLLQARLYRAATGRVMATDATGALTGWGDTPKAAIEAFNAAFDEAAKPTPPAPPTPPTAPAPSPDSLPPTEAPKPARRRPRKNLP